MIPWQTLDTARLPGQDGLITLRKRGTEFSIRIPETELMNSRVHGSEETLAEMALDQLNAPKKQPFSLADWAWDSRLLQP
jgi:hypothetical protein